MEYRRFKDTIVARLDRGEEILAQVKEIALKEEIKLASVQALGAMNKFTVGVFKKNIWQMNFAEVLKLCP